MFPSPVFASRPPAGSPRYLTLVRESAPRYGAIDPSWTDPTADVVQLADLADRSADDLLALGDRIAELARSIQVAEAEMMRLIVEFDERRGWKEAGFPNCAEWLAWRIGVRLGAARERVRTA